MNSKISELLDDAHQVLIIQADNPDGDSLASALALEQILGDLGKEPLLYCAVEMPGYLKYLPGWDRVSSDLPSQFDLSIIVDASTMTLLEKIQHSGKQGWIASKPCIVLDHHGEVSNEIPFATATINDPTKSSTGELIHSLANELNWPLNLTTQELLMTSILSDTQGLTNDLAKADTYRVMAELVAGGVNRAKLEELRREYGKMPEIIYRYKARLIDRTEFAADGRLALIVIPQSEINEFSPLYNPAPLIQGDMLQVSDVMAAVVLKTYDDGHATAAIRCNNGAPVAAELGLHFGGGGHPYASGFKTAAGRQFNEIKSECVSFATELLDKLNQE